MDGGLPLLQSFLDGGADVVGQLTHDGTLFGGELAHLLQNGGELSLFAQQLYPQLFQIGGSGGLFQCVHGCLANGFQLLFHFLSS